MEVDVPGVLRRWRVWKEKHRRRSDQTAVRNRSGKITVNQR